MAFLSKLKIILVIIVSILVGIFLGGYLFSDSIPRSFLTAGNCNQECLNLNEIVGLAGSVGVKRTKKYIPSVIMETDKTIVLDAKAIYTYDDLHYVVVPKKDILDVAHLTAEDSEYLIDSHAVIGEIVREQNLRNYQVITNGPGYQSVRYLHFHLIAN